MFLDLFLSLVSSDLGGLGLRLGLGVFLEQVSEQGKKEGIKAEQSSCLLYLNILIY